MTIDIIALTDSRLRCIDKEAPTLKDEHAGLFGSARVYTHKGGFVEQAQALRMQTCMRDA